MKINRSLYPILFLLVFMAPVRSRAQDTISDAAAIRKESLRFFLDCYCDIDYIRREIPYVNYVRDVREAQVYALITQQSAGSGGHEYTIAFEGQHEFRNMNDTLRFTSMPDDTQDRIRSEQLKLLKMGLMRYVAHTPLYREIDISHSEMLEDQEVTDRWNNWVFELNFSPWFEGEETYKEIYLENSVRVMKVTEAWKMEFDFDHEYESVTYDYEDTSYTAYQSGQDLENLIVKSINEHWSAGGALNFSSSTFSNYKFQVEIIPAIEYNIFPYHESTRRQLRMLYGIGYSSNFYKDTTIYGMIREGLFEHTFMMAYEVR